MKKYKARINHRWGAEAKIEEVEIERETKDFVWINGSRSKKRSEYANYYSKWLDAKKALYQCQKQVIMELNSRVESARNILDDIVSIPEPSKAETDEVTK